MRNDHVQSMINMGVKFRHRPSCLIGTGVSTFGSTKAKAYLIQNKSCFDVAMKHMKSIRKPCCNGEPAESVVYSDYYTYIIVNSCSFQFWHDPKTIKAAGYQVAEFSDLFLITE